MRKNVFQRIAACGVGIGVAVDVDAARTRIIEHGQNARDLAPVVGTRALEMHDLDMDTARCTDIDRFLDRFLYTVRLIAYVGEVAGVVASQHVRERDHFFPPGVRTGCRKQAR